LVTDRKSFDHNTEKMYAEYTVDENFDALIGKIEVPEELRGEANLQYIYTMS
jgi:hypothetical protein